MSERLVQLLWDKLEEVVVGGGGGGVSGGGRVSRLSCA